MMGSEAVEPWRSPSGAELEVELEEDDVEPEADTGALFSTQ